MLSYVLNFAIVLLIVNICAVLSLDIMDISGEQQRDVTHNIIKTRLDSNRRPIHSSVSAQLRNDLDKMNDSKGNIYCGSCYGGLEPESGCCNTCDDVRQAYVNRGWSFSNPDAVDQVCPTTHFSVRAPYLHSVCMKAGQKN